MLEIRELRKQYPGEPAPALAGIDLTVRRGELVAVLGRSGAGKSTLIRCLNRLVEPDAGIVRWNGEDVTGVPERQLRRMRGRMAMIFQHYHLLPRLSVLTNVLAGTFGRVPVWRSAFRHYSAAEKREAHEALEQVGLAHMAGKRADELSGGQMQRVAIARALMQRPELLLGDEPVSSLDPLTADKIMQLLAKLHREQELTLLLNLHDVALAKRYAQRIVGLAGGRIVFDGAADELSDEALKRIYPHDDGGADGSAVPIS